MATATTTTKKKTGKFFDFYKFNEKELRKGDVIVAILKDHIATKKPTLEQLTATFKPAEIKNYGLFQPLNIAIEKSKKYKRYFTDLPRIITLTDAKTKIAVTNQLTKENFKPFLDVAKKLGYKITPA